MWRRVSRTENSPSGVPLSVTPSTSATNRPSRSHSRDASAGVSVTTATNWPRRSDTPLTRSSSVSIVAGHEQWECRLDDQGFDVQDAKDPTGADVGARRGDDVLDGGAKWRREERGVAEEGDELAGRQGAVHDVLGAQVRHDARQDRR